MLCASAKIKAFEGFLAISESPATAIEQSTSPYPADSENGRVYLFYYDILQKVVTKYKKSTLTRPDNFVYVKISLFSGIEKKVLYLILTHKIKRSNSTIKF